jgi:hypothetical protein
MTVIVIDVSSGLVKAGFAGDDAPKVVFPALVARTEADGGVIREIYVGEQAAAKRGELTLLSPLGSDGSIEHWAEMELLLEGAFTRLGRNPPRVRGAADRIPSDPEGHSRGSRHAPVRAFRCTGLLPGRHHQPGPVCQQQYYGPDVGGG